jgi:hypothetical protein
MENYKLYLYKPNDTGDNFLGELLVDNLQVNIKLHEMSSISFTMPEVVNGVANQRLDEVLDGYVVELWYGRVTGVEDTDYFKLRFILHTTPLDYNDFKRTYSYEGFSFESILEFKQIDNWAGVKTKDFYRQMTYNNSTPNQYTEVAATGETIPNHPYSVTAKTVGTGKYIRIVPTTATATPLDIYVYEVREDTSTEVYNEIPYVRYTGTTYDEANFKQGYYFLDMDVNEQYVEYIYIYVPDNYADFNSQAANKKLRFKVYDNPISRHYAIGVNRNDDNPYTNMYIDLAQDAEDGDAAEYGDYAFVTQSIYSKNGLKLEHVLLGNIESRDAGLIDNDALTLDGLLYNTDFTIGTIHADIAAKYRSNLEYNNITVYQAIRDLAESFDAIPVFDTILKTVSFYPENADTWPNNGLILKYGTYLKTINKDIDASKIVTAAKGIGKDNLSIALITPDGSISWQDFSYYLDEFYINPELSLSQLNAAGFVFTLQNPSSGIYYLGISYPDSDNTSTYQSRWMEPAEAKKVAKWQFNRDFMHRVLLGEIRPSDVDYAGLNLTALDRYYDLYNIRSEAINDYVQSETVLSVKKAESFRYKYLYDHYQKIVIAGSVVPEDSERLTYYENLWTQTQSLVSSEETALEQKRKKIFETTVADSIGDKMNEVRTSLNKVTIYSITINKLNPFIKETMVNDTKFDNELDLLNAVITHVDENKIPRITINVSIVDILGAQEAYDDWNKLRVGDLVNIYYPEFNIDVEVQIREVSIDFEGHTASIVISSVRNYNKSYANYVSKVIKRLSITEKNVVSNLQDRTRTSSNESDQTYKTLNGGQINTGQSNIIFGSKNENGNSSSSFSGSGFETKTVQDVDPLTESFTFGVDKSVVIKDGTILAYYRDDTDTFTSEVEISADKGIEIRKVTGSVEDEDLLVVKKVYIDTNGNAIFAGALSAATGTFAGALSAATGSFTGSIAIGAGDSIFKADSNGIYLGDADFADAEFSVTPAGSLKSTSGTIGGFTIGADFIRSGADNTKLLLKQDATNPFISIKQATNGYANDGIFLGVDSSAPKFSMVTDSGNTYLKYNPAATYDLEIAGNAKIGPLFIGNTSASVENISFTQDGSGAGYTSISGTGPQTAQVVFDFTQSNLKSFQFNFSNNYSADLEISVYLDLGANVIKSFYYIKSSLSSGTITETNINLLCDSITIITRQMTAIGGSASIGGLGGTGFTFVETSPLISLTDFAIYPNGTVGANIFQTSTMNIFNSILSTYSASTSLELVSTRVKFRNENDQTTADSIIIEPSSANGSNTRAITLTTPTSALAASRIIRFPDAAGTIALNDAAQTFSAIKTFSAEPVFTAGAIFGSAADAANSIEITSTGNIIFEGSTADGNEIILTAANATTSDKTITIPDATGTIALMQSSTATMYIGRIWTRSYNTHTWALRRDATLQVLPTDGTYQVFDLGYTIVDDSSTADIIKVEIVGGTSSTSAGRAFVEVVAGTFQTTSGIALLSYMAFDGVNGNIITPIQYLAQYRTNGNNFEVRRPTSIRMSGGA